MQCSPVEVKRRLLSALDGDNNVVDMALVLEVMATLEQMRITKEALETTRLGKHINEMRKKTDDAVLARRAKALVRRWRDMIIPPAADSVAAATAAAAAASVVPSSACTLRRISPGPVAAAASPVTGSSASYPCSASTSPCVSRAATPLSTAATSPPARQPPNKHDVANKRKRKHQQCQQPAMSQRPVVLIDIEHEEDGRRGAATDADCGPAEKRARFNGVDDECSRDSITCEINPDTSVLQPQQAVAAVPAATVPLKKATPARRPRSSTASAESRIADLSEKLASASRRVKTTRELLCDLAERRGDSTLAQRASQCPSPRRPPPVAAAAPSLLRPQPLRQQRPPPSSSRPDDSVVSPSRRSDCRRRPERADDAVTRNKSAHMARYLNSSGGSVSGGGGATVPVVTLDDEASGSAAAAAGNSTQLAVNGGRSSSSTGESAVTPPPPRPLPTEAEILARLPPLDQELILWGDETSSPSQQPPPPPYVSVEQAGRLSHEQLDGVTGTTDGDGRFREWHLPVTVHVRDSAGDGCRRSMPILPYVIID